MGTLSDPYRNAKSWGWLLVISGCYSIFKLLPSFQINAFSATTLFTSLLSIITGYFLIKGNIKGVYWLIIQTVVGAIVLAYYYISGVANGNIVLPILTVFLILQVLITIWFYKGRNKFKK